MSRDRTLEQLPPAVQRFLPSFGKRVGAALGQALESVHLYGSAARGEYVEGRSNLNLLVTLGEFDGPRLRTLAPLLATWKKERLVTLVLRTTEVERWAEQFPLEFGDLLDHRVMVGGRDVLAGIRAVHTGLAAAIVREAHANVLRVRQRYLEGGASTESAMILMALSVTGVGVCARGLLRLWDETPSAATDAALQRVCERVGVAVEPLMEGWAVRCGRISPGQLEIPRLFDRYMDGLEQWVQRVAGALTTPGGQP